MARMEQRFNHKFRYPYVFLNNGPFSDEFKSRWGAGLACQQPVAALCTSRSLTLSGSVGSCFCQRLAPQARSCV